tara:strand:- start:19 stop:360 length:342 start_codon:yes stop_codon:yes gene_type:complete
MYDENNIFAKIIKGEIPCKKIYEDHDVLFFNDINPIAKIHVLGITKQPCINFSDFITNHDNEIITNFFKKTEMIILKLGIKNEGYRIITNSGINGRQEVPHFHIHIIGGEKLK